MLTRDDVYSFPPKSFSFNVPDTCADITAGREFLTWLWYCSEMRGGLHRSDTIGQFAYMIDGPLDFVLEGRGAHETIMKKGEPLLAAETKAALLAGKTLKQARIIFARGEEVWACSLDADVFAFKGLKLPPTESFDRVGKFQERMIHLVTFRTLFLELFTTYLAERSNNWETISNEIKHWVQNRAVQA
jgi:recombination associated protein RdgC